MLLGKLRFLNPWELTAQSGEVLVMLVRLSPRSLRRGKRQESVARVGSVTWRASSYNPHNRCICSSTPPALTKWWWLVHSSGTRFKALGAILNRMISHPREQNRKREIERERDEESVCNEAAMNLIFFSPPFPLPSRRLHYWTDRRKESCFLLSRYHQLYFIAIVDSRSLAPVSLTPHNSLTDEFSNKHNMILQFLFTSWDSPTRKTLERLLRSFTSLSDEVSARLSGKGVGG